MIASADPTPSVRRCDIVVDTNVALDWLHFGDPSCTALMHAVQIGRLRAVTNDACRAEFVRVLAYPILALAAPQRDALQRSYDASVRVMPDIGRIDHDLLPRCRDPDDQKFLQLAADTTAIALLTRDQELLRLSTRMQRVAAIEIITPATLTLDWLRQRVSAGSDAVP